MLREIPNPRQVPSEPCRRCFFSHQQDLWVWFDDNVAPIAFQLAHGKYRDEHAIRWKAGKGFAHVRVDDSENAGLVKQTPILVREGPFVAADVVSQFVTMSEGVSREIVEFVVARLREHPAYRDSE